MKDEIINNEKFLSITGKVNNKIKLTRALCNDVFLLNCDKSDFILKIASTDIRKQELKKEYEIMIKIKDISPKIYLFEEQKETSFILMEYIEDENVDIHNYNYLKNVGTLLHTIHNSTIIDEYVDYDKILKIAEYNMLNNRIDKEEFIIDGKYIEPQDMLNYLISNKPNNIKSTFLHGDYRPKNILVQAGKYYIIDFGLSFYGDYYYDLAIMKYYFSDEEFKIVINAYGVDMLDKERLQYNEILSKFLNV